MREDRGDQCFHEHITHALEVLEDPVRYPGAPGEFARKWRFVREGTFAYNNLFDQRGRRTNPDFMSGEFTGTDDHAPTFVIEAKLDPLFGNKAARDRERAPRVRVQYRSVYE